MFIPLTRLPPGLFYSARIQFSSALGHQAHVLQQPLVLLSGGDQVDPGGLNGAVAQGVRQLHDVVVFPVVLHGKQVPQIVGIYLGGLHSRLTADAFHLAPDLPSGYGRPVPGPEHRPMTDSVLPEIRFQLPAELSRQHDGPQLAL